MKYFFVILAIVAVMLTACGGQAAEEISSYIVEVDDAGYPIGDFTPSTVIVGVDIETETECARGEILGGEIYISTSSSCTVVVVPVRELNTPWGANLGRERPALRIENFVGENDFVFIHGGLSQQMQQLVLDELMQNGFYISFSERIEELAERSFREGRYWEQYNFQKGLDEYRALTETERGNCALSPLQMVDFGATYGAFLGGALGGAPQTEADAYQRGRILMIYYAGVAYPGVCDSEMGWWQQ